MSTFNTKLRNARNANFEYIKKQKAFDQLLRANAPVLKQYFEMFPPHMRKAVYMQTDFYDNTVRISVSLRGLDSFKDKKLTRLLEKFADWKAGSTDWAHDIPNRDYWFEEHTHFGIRIRVAIYAYVKSDSPLCRVVVKGVKTKIVEEEIREIVCA